MNFKKIFRPTPKIMFLAIIIFVLLPLFPHKIFMLCDSKPGQIGGCGPEKEYLSLAAAIGIGFKDVSLNFLTLLGIPLSYLFSVLILSIKFPDRDFFAATNGKIIISTIGWMSVVFLYMHYLSGVYGGTSNFPPVLSILFDASEFLGIILLPFTFMTFYLLYPGTVLLLTLAGRFTGIPMDFTRGFGFHPSSLSAVGAAIVVPILLFEWYYFACLIITAFKKRIK
ncbi:MAG: hypothetical protein ABIJ34_09605 [archaeon]